MGGGKGCWVLVGRDAGLWGLEMLGYGGIDAGL